MRYTKMIPSFFQTLLVFILISQIILLPSLAPAQQVTAVEISMLDIEVNVSGAVITIDQQKKGKAPLRDIELSVGTHHLSVTKKGYVPWTTDLVIEPGEHPVIAVVLILPDKTKEGQAPPTEKEQISPTTTTTAPEAATGPKAVPEGALVEKQKVDLGLSTGPALAEPSTSKAFYKTWWFWTLVVLAAGGAAAAAAGGGCCGGIPTPPTTAGNVSVTW